MKSRCRDSSIFRSTGSAASISTDPDLTPDRVAEALERMRATGVTRCLPTLITSSFERFAANARILADSTHAAIAGIHMEGPYLSPADGARGAHPLAHVVPATVDDFRRRQDAAVGRIVLVTLAPEVSGALALIEHLVATDVRVAIGHTARDAASSCATRSRPARRWRRIWATDVRRCCRAIRTSSGNCWPRTRYSPSMIADGHHLPGRP